MDNFIDEMLSITIPTGVWLYVVIFVINIVTKTAKVEKATNKKTRENISTKDSKGKKKKSSGFYLQNANVDSRIFLNENILPENNPPKEIERERVVFARENFEEKPYFRANRTEEISKKIDNKKREDYLYVLRKAVITKEILDKPLALRRR